MAKSTNKSVRQLLNSFRGKNIADSKEKFFGMNFTGMPGDGTPNNIGKSSDWLREYAKNPRLAGLNKIVSDNGVAEFNIYHKDSKSKTIITGHPLEKELLEHTVPMFFSLWTAYRLMSGVVYLAYELGEDGPENFKVFTASHLQNLGNNNASYKFQYGNQTLTYPENQVIVDYDLDLNSPYHEGQGRASSLAEEIELDNWIVRYMKTFYVNSARPDSYIVPKGESGPNSEDLDRLTEALNSKHKGLGNAHRTAVLTFDASIETVPNNHRDMELLETRKALRDGSIQHFGIPPEIMGIVENSNKATVVAAEHIYAKQVRMPILHHFEDIINSKILPLYDGAEEFYFEFHNILPDDEEMNMKKAEEGREGGSLTINEHRSLLGLPNLKGDAGNRLIGDRPLTEGGEVPTVEIESGEIDIGQIPYSKVAERALASRYSGGKSLTMDTVIEIVEEDEDE